MPTSSIAQVLLRLFALNWAVTGLIELAPIVLSGFQLQFRPFLLVPPLIYLLASEPNLRPRIENVMLTGRYDDISREAIREKLAANGTLEKIRNDARRYADAARKSLDVLGETEYRVALEDIPSFVIDRNM